MFDECPENDNDSMLEYKLRNFANKVEKLKCLTDLFQVTSRGTLIKLQITDKILIICYSKS